MPSRADFEKRIKESVGRDDIPFEILDVARWNINELAADRYSDGNMYVHLVLIHAVTDVDPRFCLGDAVHRHPPTNGLGSNTCIQDAYNLAWKINLVTKNIASPSILDSYNLERQPIGSAVVQRANDGLRAALQAWAALGVFEPTISARLQVLSDLQAATPEGRARRAHLNASFEGHEDEFHAIGIEMNQRYTSHTIYLADETEPPPPYPDNAVRYHLITTYPGSRLPHAWLDTPIPSPKGEVSTHDLAGKGRFTLFTGIGGEAWREAARAVEKDLGGVEIKVVAIGWRQDWEDVYRDWRGRGRLRRMGACWSGRIGWFVGGRRVWLRRGARGS